MLCCERDKQLIIHWDIKQITKLLTFTQPLNTIRENWIYLWSA